VAAAAYKLLRSFRDQYKRVVLLGPCHRYAFRGLAVSAVDVFRTPLGDVALDREMLAVLEHPAVTRSEPAHSLEHSLEVQLPFLQTVLGPFSLLPLAVGQTEPETVAAVLELLWGGPETLVVVSSDLSHYLSYDEACQRDRKTCKAVQDMDARSIGHGDACGATPLGGLLITARSRGLKVTTLDLRNSGDTAGGKSEVVGYGAWMFQEVNE
jgi:AmmeMemoRadiSam system protein B